MSLKGAQHLYTPPNATLFEYRAWKAKCENKNFKKRGGSNKLLTNFESSFLKEEEGARAECEGN